MGKPRGQRNAAREKAWPGQDAAKIRSFKHEDNWKDKDKRPGFTRALRLDAPSLFSRPGHPSAPHQNVEAEKLDKQADEILIANGSAELAYPHLRCQKEVFAPFEPCGERMRGIPSGKSITEPKGCSHLAPVKTKGQPCANCGKPVSKFSQYVGAVCRVCYSAKASVRFEGRIKQKWQRMEEHVARYSWLVENYIEMWGEMFRYVPNFAQQLENDISRWEEHIGIPFVFWKDELQFRAVEDARELPHIERPLKWRFDPKPRQNVKRMQQAAWRYS